MLTFLLSPAPLSPSWVHCSQSSCSSISCATNERHMNHPTIDPQNEVTRTTRTPSGKNIESLRPIRRHHYRRLEKQPRELVPILHRLDFLIEGPPVRETKHQVLFLDCLKRRIFDRRREPLH